MNTLEKDLYRYSGANSRLKLVYAVLSHPGARFLFLFRLVRNYSKFHPLGFLLRLWIKLMRVRYMVEIPHFTVIGAGLYMGHFQNIIINQGANIGENCNIAQGVTIGSESRGRRKGCPILGDRVVVGPNSVVVGKIKIGSNVLIGPCTFVNFDVPPDSVVLGSPGKIVSTGKGSEGYVKKILNKY